MVYRHDLDPYLLGPWHLGPWHLLGHTMGPFNNFGIRWYSLPYVGGFILIYLVLRKAVERRRIPNGTYDRLEEACLIIIASIIIGGRVGYFVLNEPHRLTTLKGWLEVPQVWHGGMAFFGAALALFLWPYFYCRKRKIGFWHGADKVMWVLALALGFGRIANFINGELYGLPTNGHWGVIFPVYQRDLINGVNVPRHPEQLYAALSHWLLAWWLVHILKRKPRTPFDRAPGFAVFHFLFGYGLLRFVTDFWRQEQIYFGPLNGGQYLSLLFMIIAVIGARVRYGFLVRKGTELDWYPEGGQDSDLPEAVHDNLPPDEEAPPPREKPSRKGKRR